MSILEAVHETAKDLHKGGTISDGKMREFDLLCKRPQAAYTPAQIRRIRERTRTSEEVFAACINTSKATVRRWECGQAKPNGPTQQLLRLIDQKGLEAVV